MKLKDLNIDLNTKVLNCSNSGITSLEGIEQFKKLEKLICYNNKITSLDVRLPENIKVIDISNNLISEINIENNNLRTITAYNNCLEKVILRGDIIEKVELFENSINYIELPENVVYLDIHSNLLTELNLTNLKKLKLLDISNNKISDIELKNKKLIYLNLTGNVINTNLNDLYNLYYLYSDKDKTYNNITIKILNGKWI